jgi:hypothetical protein
VIWCAVGVVAFDVVVDIDLLLEPVDDGRGVVVA